MQQGPVGSRSAAIGATVRLLMARHQMNAAALSQRACISQSALGRSLSGRRPFTAEELHAIANVFGRQASEIIAVAEAIEAAGFAPAPLQTQPVA